MEYNFCFYGEHHAFDIKLVKYFYDVVFVVCREPEVTRSVFCQIAEKKMPCGTWRPRPISTSISHLKGYLRVSSYIFISASLGELRRFLYPFIASL